MLTLLPVLSGALLSIIDTPLISVAGNAQG